MKYNEIEYNEKGLVKCEVCGLYFQRVSCHVNKAHGMSASEYKAKFGFKQGEGLCSEKSRQKTSKQSSSRYRMNKASLFIEMSKKTRFPKGICGRVFKCA
jgi:uncharacterized C2H2 Zn-finger protein